MDRQANKYFREEAKKLERKSDGLKPVLSDSGREQRKKELEKMLRGFHREVEDFVGAVMQASKQSFDFSRYGVTIRARKEELRREARSLGRINHGLLLAIREYERESKADGPKVTFDGEPVSSATTGKIFTLLHPGNKQPEAKLTLSGFQGKPVTIEMFHVMGKGYGGHLHQIKPKYLGEFRSESSGLLASNPSVGAASMILPPFARDVTIIYKASDVCTRRKLRISSPALAKPIEFCVDVRYKVRLYDLNQYDVPHLKLYTRDEQHPTEVCHYGTKEMVDKLESLNNQFEEALNAGTFDTKNANDALVRPTQAQIPINDMSLPWGGTFKVRGRMDKKSGHGEHKWGECVDVTYAQDKGMIDLVKQWLQREGSAVFGVKPWVESDHLHFNLTKRKINN